MSFLSTFFALNRSASRAITPAHVHEANVFGAYKKIGAMLLSHPQVFRVVDVGAGKHWHFPLHYKKWYNIQLIGLDIDSNEIMANEALDLKIVCDVMQGIPLSPQSVDLLMVHSGIEHFSDNEEFLRNSFSVLRPGGFFVAQFPDRYAPFAIANRIMPRNVTRKLLDAVAGSTAEDLGFRAFYDRTHYRGFRKIYEKVGFNCLYHLPGFYSSFYFEFFLPFYAISYMYDMLRFASGARSLASYHLWVLQRPPEPKTAMEDQSFRFYAWD